MSGESSQTNPSVLPTSLPIPSGFDTALPPWTLEAEAWWILPSIPMPWQAKVLPKGAIDPLEEVRYRDSQATYNGGMGTIQLIRYHSSPVGPYDELLYIPGNMSYKVGSTTVSGLSVTRIYVSTVASIVNGRRNWNIPKHLARFDFVPEDPTDPLSPVVASVYPSLSNSTTTEFTPDPVFKSRLVASRRIPTFPLNLGIIPRAILDLRLLQAPLVASTQEGSPVVGTERWCGITPSFSGDVRVLYPEPGLHGGKFGDGVGFPDASAMSVGLWWPKVKILFSEPEIVDGDEEDKKTK